MEPEKKPEPVKTPAPPKVPQAVEELNVVDIHGKTSFTGRAQKKAEGQAEWKDKSERINRVNLYVKNLDDNIDVERLRKEFSQFGTITSAKVETKDGRSKGFGYVCFHSPEEATKAITEMNGRTVDGKALYVTFLQRKEDRKVHLALQRSQVDGLAITEEEQEGAARTALLDDNASSVKQARAIQEDERMTEATTSRHKSNYIKIAMVLLDVSTRAVRVQFDKELLPVRLQSILKEGFDQLDNLKTMKHITQPQWNLLFPETGEHSSTDFDITLMICLLRNLTSIDIVDKLPSATDTSVEADLSRIKYYRNIIVHSDSALLDDSDFESYWNDLTPAILRLGGNSLKVECDDWYGRNLDAKQRDDGLKSTQVLALVEELLKKIKKWIESDQEKVPIIELKGHTFNVDEGKSVAIECNGFMIDEKRPPFWEWIYEDDETKKVTIREDKKDKYMLNSDPPYLRILNAEMSDRGYYRCCIEYSTSNGDEIVRSKKAHLIVEKAVKPGDIHTHIERQDYMNANQIITNNTGMVCFGEGGTFPIKCTAPEALRDNTGKRLVLFEGTNKKQIESEQEKSNPVPKNIEERAASTALLDDNASPFKQPMVPQEDHMKEDSNMLYRLLHPDESWRDGLCAKNPHSTTSVFDHVIKGRNRTPSKYISTCGSWKAVNYFQSKSEYPRRIAKIQKDKLPSSVEIIDLRLQENRDIYIDNDEDTDSIGKFKKFAKRYEVVLLVGHVPESCIELCDD